MYILNLNMCNNSGVLTVFMIVGIIITIAKIVVPFLVMFSCISKIAPEIMNGESLVKHISPLVKSIVAAFIVFFAPTLINALLVMMSPDYNSDSYSACVSNANLNKIKELKKAEQQSKDSGPQVIQYEHSQYRPSTEKDKEGDSGYTGTSGGVTGNTGGNSSGYSESSNRSGIWVNSVSPLPSGATSCRSSVFGPRTNPITGAFENHSGDDYPAPCGTSVFAVLDGTVVDMANDNGYHGGRGNYVTIKHKDGKSTVYMHSSRVLVSVGQPVRAGQEIMKVGTTGASTGCHLHITVKDTNGNNIAPSNHIPTLRSCS